VSRKPIGNKVELLRRAEEMIGAGSTERDAAYKICVSPMTLHYWRRPEKYEMFKTYARERFRERERIKTTREQNIRKTRRVMARQEAAVTGQLVDEIYKRWGVA
jgi:hypothetical protein